MTVPVADGDDCLVDDGGDTALVLLKGNEIVEKFAKDASVWLGNAEELASALQPRERRSRESLDTRAYSRGSCSRDKLAVTTRCSREKLAVVRSLQP